MLGIAMPRYELIIYWSEEDQAFIAEVPELPGCTADGSLIEGGVCGGQRVFAYTSIRANLGTSRVHRGGARRY